MPLRSPPVPMDHVCVCFKAPRTRSPGPQCVLGDPAQDQVSQFEVIGKKITRPQL